MADASYEYGPGIRKVVIIVGIVELIILFGSIITSIGLFCLAQNNMVSNSTGPSQVKAVITDVPPDIDWNEDEEGDDIDTNIEPTPATTLSPPTDVKLMRKYYLKGLVGGLSALGLAALILVLTILGAVKMRSNWILPRLVIQVRTMLGHHKTP